MGHARTLAIGLALAIGQTAAAYAADLGLPPPPPEPCVGCAGPWYFKGYIGQANPEVGDIFAEEFNFNDTFVVHHKDIKSTPLYGIGFGYDTGHWFRFDITGEYRGSAVFLAEDSYQDFGGGRTNTPPISRAGSACSTPISISAPGIA